LSFSVVNEVIEKKWEEYVVKHPNSNPFQLPWMYHFYEKVKGYEPIKLFVIDENSEIKACLIAVIIKEGSGIRGKLSSRIIVSGAPLINFNEDNSFEYFKEIIVSFLNKFSKSSVYIEFRNFFEFETAYREFLYGRRFYFEENVNFIVNLKKTPNPLSYFSESKRRQINRAIKENTEVSIAQTIEEVKDFYNILVDLYKYRAKKPLADWSFFKVFFETICHQGNGGYLLIKYKNKVIGGIMCIISNDTIYEWYVCGMDKEYKYNYPSVLATWSAIDFGYRKGLSYFDFLGAGNPKEKYGVRYFKSKFGGETYNYGRFVRINYPIIFKLGKYLVKIYSRFF